MFFWVLPHSVTVCVTAPLQVKENTNIPHLLGHSMEPMDFALIFHKLNSVISKESYPLVQYHGLIKDTGKLTGTTRQKLEKAHTTLKS